MGTLMQTHPDGPSYHEMWYDDENWQFWLLRIGLPILAVLIVVGGIAVLR